MGGYLWLSKIEKNEGCEKYYAAIARLQGGCIYWEALMGYIAHFGCSKFIEKKT